ncbi:MAG: hypothetical protein FJ207_15620 [Gemmatimonadetes bacterium]|nr:hypothetical protein [Gemmatimonadota bacterium]
MISVFTEFAMKHFFCASSYVAARTAERVARVFRKHGRSLETPAEDDPLPDTEPVLASCYAAAAGGLAVSGARAGRPLLRLVDPRLSHPGELVGGSGQSFRNPQHRHRTP